MQYIQCCGGSGLVYETSQSIASLREKGVHAGVAYSFDGSTHYFLVSIWHIHMSSAHAHAVGENISGEFFVLIQSMDVGRNFYPAKILCYTAKATNQ